MHQGINHQFHAKIWKCPLTHLFSREWIFYFHSSCSFYEKLRNEVSHFKTEDDLFQISLLATDNQNDIKLSIYHDNDIEYKENEENKIISKTTISVQNGTVVCGQFDQLSQEQSGCSLFYWLYFTTSKAILNFFLNRNKAIWECYTKNNYPTYDTQKKNLQ